MDGQSTYLLALIFKIIKILLYFFFQVIFIRRVVKKWDAKEPITLEICTFIFFFCMMLGSLCEIVWIQTNYIFYSAIGVLYIYSIGFIALTFLSIGIERGAHLKTRGLIALVPFIIAVAILVVGTMEVLALPYYFIALVVGMIPALFLYLGYASAGIIRRQFIYIGFGYLLVFLGEALNYNIILFNFAWLNDYFISITGYTVEFIPPIIIIIGLLFLFNGYVRLARKITI